MQNKIIRRLLSLFPVFSGLYHIFHNDEHHIISEMGKLILEYSTHDELRIIVKESQQGAMIEPQIIGNELYLWIYRDGKKSLLYKRWLKQGYGVVMDRMPFRATDTESFNNSHHD